MPVQTQRARAIRAELKTSPPLLRRLALLLELVAIYRKMADPG